MTTGPAARTGRPAVSESPTIDSVIGILTGASRERRSGILRVTGEPGGEFHVLRGIIIAVNSPGAPGVPELLAQPGRRAPGSVELRVLHSTATLDAAFAVAAGWIGDCFWAKTEAQRAVPDPGSGLEPELLEAEITRRLRGIAPGHIAPHRDHLVRTALGETALRDEEAGPRREILLRINGRRTCRDLAFLLGRGLYPITVEVSWWNAKGVVGVTDRDPYVDTATLPRRRRDASGINELYPPGPGQRAAEGT